MIAIIDFGAGNLSSVKNALDYLKVDSKITSDPKDLAKAEKIIFPGVGSFGAAMKNLKKLNLIEPIRNEIQNKKPFFGICLGMQLLFEESEESPGIKGLGIFKGKAKKFNVKLKIPQIGWNQLTIKKGKVFKGIKNNSFVYFVHSYYVEPKDKSIISAKTDYGINFTSAIQKDNICAVQFHPEKSGTVGIKMLENFIKC